MSVDVLEGNTENQIVSPKEINIIKDCTAMGMRRSVEMM